MAFQAAPLFSTTQLSNYVPGRSDRHAQVLSNGNLDNFILGQNFSACYVLYIISVIAHENSITQTEEHQFVCELF